MCLRFGSDKVKWLICIIQFRDYLQFALFLKLIYVSPVHFFDYYCISLTCALRPYRQFFLFIIIKVYSVRFDRVHHCAIELSDNQVK